MGIPSPQVVVIGGGIIGTSITYYLSKAGVDVALFERGDIASGTSGACSAAITMQTKGSGLKLELAMESRMLYELLSQELGEDVEYEQEGGMIVAETEEELQYISSLVRRQRESALSLDLLGRKEIKERQPNLNDCVIASTFCRLDGKVNPLKVTFGYARAAKRCGARIYTFNQVTAIHIKKGRVSGIDTSLGKIATECVVNAAGVWAPEVGKMIGLTIPIEPRRGILLVSEVIPPLIRGSFFSAKYLMSKYSDEPGAEARPGIKGFTGGLTIRHTRSGNLLFGSSREFAGFNTHTTHGGMTYLVKEAARLFPVLRGVCVIRTFTGLRPFTPDGLPVLGKVPGLEGFIMAAGHEGDGISLAPITGKMIGGLIAKGEVPESLTALNLERFMQ